jgi:carboxynorspermidine decarboxylase
MGGGYLVQEAANQQFLSRSIDLLRGQHGVDVFFEPGAAFVRDAGYVVTTVLDVTRRRGVDCAIVDTTVNHIPEVFEFNFEPDLAEERPNGRYKTLVTGRSCLAGDVLGVYQLSRRPAVGMRFVFPRMGAYSIVKSNWFNGINLPLVYSLMDDTSIDLVKQHSLSEFISRCGGPASAS